MTDDRQERDVAFIRALAELLRENELTELQVKRDYAEEGSLNVRVARQLTVAAAPQPAAVPAPEPAPAAERGATVVAAEENGQSIEDPAQLPGGVPSPTVGTLYRAPEPGAARFVSVGDNVEEGQTLLIVEAMKTMNQIPAPRGGKVMRILVEDGAPVEFGAPLMVID